MQRKLLFPILLILAVTFLAVLFLCLTYFNRSYLEREINVQQKQMDRAAYSISAMQNTIENISRQIVVSKAVQEDIRDAEKDPAKYLIASDSIQKELGTYSFIADYIQEILILTKEGKVYSSLPFRDGFDPEKEQWYLKFRETEAKKGYTGVHTATVSQNGQKKEVISYVLTYYSLADYDQEAGTLIITIDYSSLVKAASLDMSLLNGYSVYDADGNSILSYGNVETDPGRIRNSENGRIKEENGNVCLVSNDLGNEWIMAAEISRHALWKQILPLEIFASAGFIILTVLIVAVLFHSIEKVVAAEHERIIRKSQVDQLLLQINPHFIYNTLNSIVYMARMDGNQEIEEFTNAFTALLQNTLHVENKVYIPLGEEIKNVENYLILQKYRYLDKFEEDIHCPQELKGYLVPKVILQPIVENAIFHGIAPMEGKGKLSISVERFRERIRISVKDNGVGMSEERIRQVMDPELKSSGDMRKIGIGNVYRRIREICGESSSFSIESCEGCGTKVIMELPMKKEDMDDRDSK